MDLKPSPEYIEFRKEVKSFLKDNIDMAGKARNPARPNKNELDWQDKLIKMVMRPEQFQKIMVVTEQSRMYLNQE